MIGRADSQSRAGFLDVPKICATITIGIALLALLGWVSGVRSLAGGLDAYIPMAPSTAVAFLLLGGVLFSFAHLPVMRLGRFFALTAVSVVLLMALLVLVQFIFGLDFGMEHVLSRTNEFLGSMPLGRMASLTAVAFLLEGAAFFILLAGGSRRNVPVTIALLAAGATVINAVVLVGYAYGAPLLYGGTNIPVALPTAIAFVLIGTGQLNLVAPGIRAFHKWRGASIRGILLRAFLPFMLFFVLLDGWVSARFGSRLPLNPPLWNSLKAITAGVLIVIITGWIARRSGNEIERAQRSLAESEAKFRHVFENSPLGKSLTGADGTLKVNKAFCEIVGYSEEELRAKNWQEITHPDDIEESQRAFQSLLDGEISSAHFEKRYIHKAGNLVWTDVITALQRDESGNPLYFLTTINDITERKQAAEALYESEERLRLSTELANVAVWEYSFITNSMSRSKNHDRLYGLEWQTRWDINTFLNATHPDDREFSNEIIQKSAASGGPDQYQFDFRVVYADQSIHWLTVIGQVVERTVDGQGTIVRGCLIDITERKRAEEKLRQSEQKFSLIFEKAAFAAILSTLPDGVIIDANEAWSKISGYTRQEMLGKTSLEVGVNPDNEMRKHILAELQTKGSAHHQEIPVYTKSGEQRIFSVNIDLVEMGKQKFILNTAEDITERKHAEKKIIQLTRMYATLSQVNQTIVRIKDRNELYQSLCDVALQFGGFSLAWIGLLEEATGDILPIAAKGLDVNQWPFQKVNLYSGANKNGLVAAAIRTARVATSKDIQTDDRTQNSREQVQAYDFHSIAAIPIKLRDKVIGILGLVSSEVGFFKDEEEIRLLEEMGLDISFALDTMETETGRRQAEEEIKKLNAELEARVIQRTAQLESANKELEAFAYSVSHDLRAPLRAITGYTNILMEDYEPAFDAEGKRVCSVISGEAQRMGQLIDDLLTFSRLNRTEMNNLTIDMQAMAQTIYNELTPIEGRERIDLQIENLHSSVGDPALIRQVWVNLLSNAIKFTSKKERAVIEVMSTQNADETIYSVRDNGAGFDMQYAGKLFGVFQRLHTDREFEGTGVGLAIVQRVILRHGGRVWSEGRVDQGAVFYFALPRKEASHE